MRAGFFRALITETASLPFADLPVSRLAGGDWTFERAPTETFAGFQQTFRAPQPLRLKTDQISAVRRNEPLTIEWENHGYSSNDGVTVTMNVSNGPSAQYTAVCRAPASALSVTIPMDVLSKIPAEVSGTNASIMVSLARNRDVPLLFRTPMKGGREAAGVFSYSFIDSILVPVE